ncbi:hypothetical protein [Pedobacter westerhofensis]|nr:hypothetical protein [Pedobacter westerhofensis]
MKNQTALNPTFWSGVINYVRASAQPAEELTPWDFREQIEKKTVLVFSTSIAGITEQLMVTSRLNALVGEKNWTIDLEDVDHVLRVVCPKSAESKIISIFEDQAEHCELMS